LSKVVNRTCRLLKKVNIPQALETGEHPTPTKDLQPRSRGHSGQGLMTMDRKALQKLSYGVYILTSGRDDGCNGQTANTVFQISSEPETSVSINKNNYTNEPIKKTVSWQSRCSRREPHRSSSPASVSGAGENWTSSKASTTRLKKQAQEYF